MGATIEGLSGVLGYGFNEFRVRATQNGENSVTKENDRPTTPDVMGGDLTVASFNVLNFLTIFEDDTARNNNLQSAVTSSLEPRDANDFNFDGNAPEPGDPSYVPYAREFDRQLEKLVTTITTMDVDILGLVELENDFGIGSAGDAFAALVDALNTELRSIVYDWVYPGRDFVDTGDAISQGFLYKTDTVRIAWGTTVEILDDSDLPGLGLGALPAVFDGASTNRAALAVTFEELSSGETFIAVANHFKSKGSVGTAGALDQDQGDGAGFANQTRLNGATALDAWIDTDPTGSGDSNFMILDDLNAYAMETPISFLEGEDYTDLGRHFGRSDIYSFVFDGQAGALDHTLANSELLDQVTGATEWHINANEPDAIDCNLDLNRDPSIFDETVPFRNSDHEPNFIGLDLGASSGPNLVDGTSGNNVLTGTSEQDLIETNDGRLDIVRGGGLGDNNIFDF